MNYMEFVLDMRKRYENADFHDTNIVNEINQMAGLYLSYEQSIKNEDSSKLMVANEFGNFADIFSNFAKMLKYSYKMHNLYEKRRKFAFF